MTKWYVVTIDYSGGHSLIYGPWDDAKNARTFAELYPITVEVEDITVVTLFSPESLPKAGPEREQL